MKKNLLILIVLSVIVSCNDFVIKNNFLGNYFLIATDIGQDLDLCYHEPSDESNYGTIVQATVFEVGYNNKFIIAGQHPKADRRITNYFILPLKERFDRQSKNGLIGPFTFNQFEQKKKELRIENIKFTVIYKDLE